MTSTRVGWHTRNTDCMRRVISFQANDSGGIGFWRRIVRLCSLARAFFHENPNEYDWHGMHTNAEIANTKLCKRNDGLHRRFPNQFAGWLSSPVARKKHTHFARDKDGNRFCDYAIGIVYGDLHSASSWNMQTYIMVIVCGTSMMMTTLWELNADLPSQLYPFLFSS